MAYGESNGRMTDDVTVTWPRRVKSWPQYAWSQYLENSWICY